MFVWQPSLSCNEISLLLKHEETVTLCSYCKWSFHVHWCWVVYYQWSCGDLLQVMPMKSWVSPGNLVWLVWVFSSIEWVVGLAALFFLLLSSFTACLPVRLPFSQTISPSNQGVHPKLHPFHCLTQFPKLHPFYWLTQLLAGWWIFPEMWTCFKK